MPWPPNGDYYIFRDESIKAKAPPVSGVYGLYDLKRYILIGESADVRAALLHHEKETGFWFGLYRPIGFTFEICPAGLRAQRAQELIAEYRPALQRRAFFVGKLRQRRRVAVSESGSAAAKENTDQITPVLLDEGKEGVRRFYFSRDQLWVVALAFAVTGLSIGGLGILTGKDIEATRIVQNDLSPVKIPLDRPIEELESAPEAQAEEGPSSPRAATNGLDAQPLGKEPPGTGREREGFQAAIKEPKPDSVVKTDATSTAQRAEKGAERLASLPPVTDERQPPQAAQREESGKRWVVQVKASPDKGVADLWTVTLKTKGYKAFIVTADIKGHTWYRVRVGPFGTREEAETSRTVLQSKEGFGDAFLAN